MADEETRALAAKALAKLGAQKSNRLMWAERVPDPDQKSGKSEDALDKRAFRKGGFSKAEKTAYAREKAMEDLLQPPKNPPPAWLSDPSLLPKAPPGRSNEE